MTEKSIPELAQSFAAEVMARGIWQERQRILKLLEGYFRPEEAKAIYPADYEQYLDIVALIKGENK